MEWFDQRRAQSYPAAETPKAQYGAPVQWGWHQTDDAATVLGAMFADQLVSPNELYLPR